MQNFAAVFDSGLGGLTVLAELKKVAPDCNFLYLADHGFCPYGTKSFAQLQSRVTKIGAFLKNAGAQSIVVACNTASLFAPALRKQLRLPVYDVIYPTCCDVLKYTYGRNYEHCEVRRFITENSDLQISRRKVALLATNATVKSGMYSRVLGCFGVQTASFCCSEMVPLAENSAPELMRVQTVRRCLQQFRPEDFDAVILGCTHFPLLITEISACTGNIEILSSSVSVSKYFARSNFVKGEGRTEFYTTGSLSDAGRASLRCNAKFSRIELT